MAKYIINKNKQDSASGENHEVHNEDVCVHLPYAQNRLPVGNFSNCEDAMEEAKKKYPEWEDSIDGCYWSCHPCHKE